MTTMTLEAFQSDYDWGEAFACAMRDSITTVAESTASPMAFERGDVAEVIASADGENDESSWIGVFRLTDGRFAFVEAGCDFTGWGCQDGGRAVVGSTLAEVTRFGCGDEDRERLGLVLK